MAMFDISLVRQTNFHLLVKWKIMTIVKNTLSRINEQGAKLLCVRAIGAREKINTRSSVQ